MGVGHGNWQGMWLHQGIMGVGMPVPMGGGMGGYHHGDNRRLFRDNY